MKRSKTSAHARRISPGAAGMMRSSSTMSTKSSSVNNPLAGANLMAPPMTPPIIPSQPVDGAYRFDIWPSPQRLPEASASLPGGGLEDVGMDVSQFLQLKGQNVPATPIAAATTTSSRDYLSPTDMYPYSPVGGIPSSCGSLTTDGATLETNMSRQSSNVYDNMSISGHIGMMRLESQSSSQTSGLSYQDSAHPVMMGIRPGTNEEDLLGLGASLSLSPVPMLSHMSMGRSDSCGSIDSNAVLHGSASMERCDSNSSIRSNQSLKRRAKEALTRHNSNAVNAPMLQPKPHSATNYASARSKSRDGKKEIANSKTRYERPRHPKVKCTQCDDYPDGFRGEHELRRHTEAKHKGLVRKWVCQDPRAQGIASTLSAVNPLDRCKQCNQNKKYGAYYNAAAHLRRTHFKEKPSRKGQNRSSRADGTLEKRGGKGGGDWPPMSELKNWMKEIQVPVDQEDDFSDDQENDMVGTALMSPSSVNGSLEMLAANMNFDPAAFGNMDYQNLSDLPAEAIFMPLSSANFCETHISYDLDSHASPVGSSNATVTQGNMYGDAGAFEGISLSHIGVVSKDHAEFGFAVPFPSSMTPC